MSTTQQYQTQHTQSMYAVITLTAKNHKNLHHYIEMHALL